MREFNLHSLIEESSAGRTFDGIGAVSAGASSRLLIDYPEPQRGKILDYLFKPGFGASLQYLKVEIGSDVNSTDGAEPSHARSRDEMEHPKPEYFFRGYEWWLMKEARKRNGKIILEGLQWGAPGWFEPDSPENISRHSRFYSKDNINYIIGYLKGLRKYHGIEMNYIGGIWNESGFDSRWMIELRSELDKNGFPTVGINATDALGKVFADFIQELLSDQRLFRSIHAVGTHYPAPETEGTLPEGLKDCKKPLWSGEDGVWAEEPGGPAPECGTWESALFLARMMNVHYIENKITKSGIWSLVSSCYNQMPFRKSGLMEANTPWSGYYRIYPVLWAVAHTTQFAQPGWQYVDDGCGFLQDGGLGSCITLRKPGTGDFCIVAETSRLASAVKASFILPEGLPRKKVHIWRSCKRQQFSRFKAVNPVNGRIGISIEPEAIYTLTTVDSPLVFPAAEDENNRFPFPYEEDFSNYGTGATPKYFSSYAGIFEVCADGDGKRYLRQELEGHGIEWNMPVLGPNPDPYGIFGDSAWSDYGVYTGIRFSDKGYGAVYGRLFGKDMWRGLRGDSPPEGYGFKLYHDGKWEVFKTVDENPPGAINGRRKTCVLGSGIVPLKKGCWQRIELKFSGTLIQGIVNGQTVAAVEDSTFSNGLAALGSGYHTLSFRDLRILPVDGINGKGG